MDEKFITVLKALSENAKLTKDMSDDMIIKAFPKSEYTEGSACKAHFRRLVKYIISRRRNIDALEVILNLINLIYPKLYTEASTLDNYFSQDIRVPITKLYGLKSPEHNLALELTALPDEVKGALIKEQKEKLVKRHTEIVKFNAEETLKVIQDNIMSDDPFRKIIALSLASGCRPIELFTKSNFTVVEENDFIHQRGHWVEQDYVAKKKEEKVAVIKPILVLTPEQFIRELGKTRIELHKRYKNFLNKNEQLSSSLNTGANVAMKAIYSNKKHFTFYSCRKMYGALSYNIYGRYKNRFGKSLSKQLWLSLTLGHRENDMTTANNYAHFELEEDDNETSADGSTEPITNLVRVKTENIPKALNLPTAIKKIKDYYSKLTHKPTQSGLEVLLKNEYPRSVIRLAYKEIKIML